MDRNPSASRWQELKLGAGREDGMRIRREPGQHVARAPARRKGGRARGENDGGDTGNDYIASRVRDARQAESDRAEALFASTLQPSAQPSPEEVFRNVATTLRRLGPRGCAALMAAEFGDHPEAAVARMNWAQTTIDTAYPTPLPSMTPTANLRPFAQAC
jgi:hypothetical protein